MVNPNKNLDKVFYEALQSDSFSLNSHRIRKYIGQIVKADTDTTLADYCARAHYLKNRAWVWIDRHGVTSQADTLLACLQGLDDMGFSLKKFRVPQIERDLQRMRTLEFDTVSHDINRVMARLEYNLTKAYLRYTMGQRFGFMNPHFVFNRLDTDVDTKGNSIYQKLFDIPMDLPNKEFAETVMRKVGADSVGPLLRDVQPHDALYDRLQKMLASGDLQGASRAVVLCNMERSRWRYKHKINKQKKYVMVNVPSYHLSAVDGDSVLSMRVVCGTFQTKTPLLTSQIKRMDINPQWIIPQSIVDRDIARHAGNTYYFQSRRYQVRDRRSGKTVEPWRASYNKLKNRDYIVVQEGGAGNALGRIIFRFDNNFAVYLHDTPSKYAFNRDDRSASHGCVRVEKPLELAYFMLKKKDEELEEKIKFSMEADSSATSWSQEVKPEIPLFITYYTLYPNQEGKLEQFNDVYGYDRVIYNYLRNYR